MKQKRAALVVISVLGCLAVGAGLEHVRHALAVPEQTVEPTSAAPVFSQTVRSITVTNDVSARAANEDLRRRIAELEQLVAKQAEEPAAVAEPEKPAEERRERDGRSRWQSFAADLEKMKTENPEQYAEIQKRREEERLSREQRVQDRVSFLDAVSTQNMSDEQRENHEKLVNTIARLSELRSLMEQQGVERTPEMRQEMGAAFESLGELYGAERRYLIEETARAVGYEGGQVAEFADHMQTIIDNTTMSGGRHGSWGRDGSGRVGTTAAEAGR